MYYTLKLLVKVNNLWTICFGCIKHKSIRCHLIIAGVCMSSHGTDFVCVLVFIYRTPAVNLMPHMALRIPSGAPPPSVAWPHPLPPVGCHRTWNCPRVPLTYQPASTAHLVTILSMLVHRQYWQLACRHIQVSVSSGTSMNLVLPSSLWQVVKAPRPLAPLRPPHLLLASLMSFPLCLCLAVPPVRHARYFCGGWPFVWISSIHLRR